MITASPTLAGESRRAIKHYSKSPILDRPGKEVSFACQKHFKVPQVPNHLVTILFTEKDAEGVSYTHDDTLVITLKNRHR